LAKLHIEYELLPVINGPRRDDSLGICKALEDRYPVIRTLCIEEGGWGRAVQAGLAAARGDLLCYANSARTSGKDLLLFLMYGSVHDDSVIKANRKIPRKLEAPSGLAALQPRMPLRFRPGLLGTSMNAEGFTVIGPPSDLQSHDDLIDLEFNAICRSGLPCARSAYLQHQPAFGRSTTESGFCVSHVYGVFRLRRELREAQRAK